MRWRKKTSRHGTAAGTTRNWVWVRIALCLTSTTLHHDSGRLIDVTKQIPFFHKA